MGKDESLLLYVEAPHGSRRKIELTYILKEAQLEHMRLIVAH